MLLLLVLACATPSIRPAYDKAAAAVATTPALPATWEPDLRLRVSRETIADLAGEELKKLAAVERSLKAGLIQATPTLQLDAARIAKRKAACAQCVPLDLAVGGNVDIKAPMIKTSVKAKITAKVDIEVITSQEDGLWLITAKPRRLTDLSVSIPSLPKLIAPKLTGPLRDFIEARLQEELKPVRIAKLGTKTLPVLAARIHSDARSVVAEVRTASPTPGKLTGNAVLSGQDAVLEIASQSLVGLVAQETFKAGPVAEGIVPELRGIEVSEGSLAVDLRLWHPDEPSWWRDFDVTGTAGFDKNTLELAATEVTARTASKGAAMADPLIAIGQALLLSQVVDYLKVALPTQHKAIVGKKTAAFQLTALTGRPDAVVVRANLNSVK